MQNGYSNVKLTL